MRQMQLFVHCICLLSNHKAQGVLSATDTDGHLLDLGTDVFQWCVHQAMHDKIL